MSSDIKKCDDCGFYFWIETMYTPYDKGYLCEVCMQKIFDNAWEEVEKMREAYGISFDDFEVS